MPNILQPHLEEAGNENTLDTGNTSAQVISLLSGVNKKLGTKLRLQQYDEVVSVLTSPLMSSISLEEQGSVYSAFREHIAGFQISDFESFKKFITLFSAITTIDNSTSWFKPRSFIIPELIKKITTLSIDYFSITNIQQRQIVQKIVEISVLIKSSKWLLASQYEGIKDFFPSMRRDMIVTGVERIFSSKEFGLLAVLVSEMYETSGVAYKLVVAEILKSAFNNQSEEETQRFMIIFLNSFDIKEDESDIIHMMKSKRNPEELHRAFLPDFWERDNTTVSLGKFVMREMMNSQEMTQHLQSGNFDGVRKEIEKYEKNKMVNVQDLYYALETAVEDYIEALKFPKDISQVSGFLEFSDWAIEKYSAVFANKFKDSEMGANPFLKENINHKIQLKLRVYIEKYHAGIIKNKSLEQDFDGVFEIQEMAEILGFGEVYKGLIREMFNHKFQEYAREAFKNDQFDTLLKLCTYFAEKNKDDDILFRNFWYILKQIHQKYLILSDGSHSRELGAFKVWMQKIILVSGAYPELHGVYWEKHIQEDTARYSSLIFWGEIKAEKNEETVVILSKVGHKK